MSTDELPNLGFPWPAEFWQNQEVVEADVAFGSRSEVKVLYSTVNPECSCEPRWSEYAEAEEQDRSVKQLGAASAIVQRFTRSKNGPWKASSLEIQSSLLKTALSRALQGYIGYSVPDNGAAEFHFPFQPLFHRFLAIFHLRQQEMDNQTRDLISLLIDTLSPTFIPMNNRLRNPQGVAFHDLWMAFAPGDLVLRQVEGVWEAAQLHEIKMITTPQGGFWNAILHSIEWNGRYFGVLESQAKIPYSDEPYVLDKLAIVPLARSSKAKEIREELKARAETYIRLCTHNYQVRLYAGTKYVLDSESSVIREKPLCGKIVIDPFAYFTIESDERPKHPKLNPSKVNAFFSGDRKQFQVGIDLSNEQNPREHELEKMTEARRLCLTNRVKGFDLRNNDWCEFKVDSLQDCTWNEDALDKLVLPEGDKTMLLAFTQRDKFEIEEFDDVIPDKGKGVIILLSGPPGVGKTLTAESVAERSHIPMYSLKASDLGTDPSEVESTLWNALECCKLWNAVLLIDEADVFLEARSADRMEQNELISIFLRNLEYYQGIMFLTTNRVESIDTAFRSRIDLILPYPDLDHPARRQIWSSFLEPMAKKRSFSEGEYDELAKADLNGREIKNAVKISRFVAASDGKELHMEQLRTILNIRKRLKKD